MPLYVNSAGERADRAGYRRGAWTVGSGRFHQGYDADVRPTGLCGGGAESLSSRRRRTAKTTIEVRKARLRDPSIIRDIEGAIGFLKNHPQVDGGKLGIVGFCMGGRLVYLMSAASKDLKAGVMFYGGSTMEPYGEAGPTPFDRTREINCPIQGHFGADDQNPSPEDMRKLDAELTQVRQTSRISQLRRRGARLRQFRIGKLSTACRRAIVAEGDGIFWPAFGRIGEPAVPSIVPIVQAVQIVRLNLWQPAYSR